MSKVPDKNKSIEDKKDQKDKKDENKKDEDKKQISLRVFEEDDYFEEFEEGKIKLKLI